MFNSVLCNQITQLSSFYVVCFHIMNFILLLVEILQEIEGFTPVHIYAWAHICWLIAQDEKTHFKKLN